MEMMLTNNPAQLAKLLGLGEIRSDLPYDFSCFLADNCQDICISRIEDQIVRMKSLIPFIVPFIFSENRYTVNMHPVSSGFSMKARISEQNIFCSFIKIKFFKMIGSAPAPQGISFPVYFNDFVINQFFIGNLMIVYIFMCQNDRVSTICLRFSAWIIIPYRIALSLIVMMLSCLPGRLFSRICDQLCMVEFPDDISVIVYLYQIDLILICIFSAAFSSSSHHIASRKKLVRESSQSCPQIHFISVHVDQKCTLCRWIDSVAIICFLFVIY